MREIANTEPTPPRRHVAAIPRELETIVLKAMEKNPADRYLSAIELADDLRSFLEHRPIRARRASWIESSVKWMKRRPLVAALVGVSILAIVGLVGGVLGTTLALAEAKRQADEVKLQKEFVEEERP